MRIGVPTEIMADEKRVALTAAGARELTARGHEVFIQAGAGSGCSITDDDYSREGATIVSDARDVFAEADLIVKVKEPQSSEIELLEPRHSLFAYLHLAPAAALTS